MYTSLVVSFLQLGPTTYKPPEFPKIVLPAGSPWGTFHTLVIMVGTHHE